MPMTDVSEMGALAVDMVDRAPVSYTHLRAHETVLDLVCRLLLEKKNHNNARRKLRMVNNP